MSAVHRKKPSQVADVAVQFLSSVVGRGLYLVLQVVLARQLGPFEFGLYSIGWTVVGLVGTLTTVGMPQAVLRYGIGGRASLTSQPVAIAAAVGLAATILIAVLADWIAMAVFAEPAAGPVIRAFAPSIFAAGLVGVMISSLRVTGAISLSALLGVGLFAFSLGLTLVAFVFWANAASAAAMYSLATVLTLVGATVLLGRQPSASGAPGLRALCRFGLITMCIHSSNVLNIWADRIVIGILSDAEAVGIYQVASQLAMVTVVLRAAAITVFETKVPKQQPGGGVPDVTRDFFAASRILLHVTGPGLIVLGLTANFWVQLLFGTAYDAAAAPLIVLLVGQLLLTLMGPSVNALHMTGDERMVLALTFGSMVLNLAGNAVLIPWLGTTGAAAASVAANSLVSLVCLVRLVRTDRLRVSFAWFRDVALGIMASLLIAGLLVHAMGSPTVVQVCLIGVAAYAAYGTIVATVCTVEDDLISLARAAFAKGLLWAKRHGRAGALAMHSIAKRQSR